MAAPHPPSPSDRLTQIIRDYQLSPAAIAAGLGWRVEKTEWLLGLHTPAGAVRPRPHLGHAKLDQLAIGCELAQAGLFDAVTADEITAALATPAAGQWIEFTERCRRARVPYWVGGPFPQNRWPETITHLRDRVRTAAAVVGGAIGGRGRAIDARGRRAAWGQAIREMSVEECLDYLAIWSSSAREGML